MPRKFMRMTSLLEGRGGIPPPPRRIYLEVDQVTDLWNEWSFGRGSGPSIQQLDSAWGAN